MLQGEAWSGVRELGGDRYELGGKVWERWGGVRKGGERRSAMEVSIIRTCDGDLYSSYEGSYGVRGDECVTEEAS